MKTLKYSIFWSYPPLPQFLRAPPQLPTLNFMFFFSLKRTKQNSNKKKTINKQTNKKRNKTKGYRNPVSSFCVGHTLLSMGPTLKCGWYTQWDSIGENWFSLLQITSRLGEGILCPLPLLSAETLCSLNLCKSCAWHYTASVSSFIH